MQVPKHFRGAVLLSLLSTAALAGTARAAAVALGPQPMFTHPQLPVRKVTYHVSPAQVALWKTCLRSTHVFWQRTAAEAIYAAAGSDKKLAGLNAMAPALLALLRRRNIAGSVRTACLCALTRLHTPRAATALLRSDQSGTERVVLKADPVLATQPSGALLSAAESLWLARINNQKTRLAILLSAVHSVGAAHDNAAAGALLTLLGKPRAQLVHVAAARALGRLSFLSKPSVAAAYALRPGAANQLIAACLLAKPRTVTEQTILIKLVRGRHPSVIAAAQRALVATAPMRLLPLDAALAGNADMSVRLLAARGMQRQAQAAPIKILIGLLGDRRTAVREAARAALIHLAGEKRRAAVARALQNSLAKENWRGLQEAALALGQLRVIAAGPNLLKLLKNKHMPARVAATVALRQLKSKPTLPALLAYAKSIMGGAKYPRPAAPNRRAAIGVRRTGHEVAIQQQLTQIFQNFGLCRYHAAQPLMLTFVPKTWRLGAPVRSAAIWALAQLHQNHHKAPLVAELIQRLNGRYATPR